MFTTDNKTLPNKSLISWLPGFKAEFRTEYIQVLSELRYGGFGS